MIRVPERMLSLKFDSGPSSCMYSKMGSNLTAMATTVSANGLLFTSS